MVQVLDVISNDIMLKRLLHSGVVCMVVSEENEQQIYAPAEQMETSRYAVAMDPLDGSSNIACNIPVGTIFGIWRREHAEKTHPGPDLFLGRKLVASGYVLYGPSCMLVYSTGQGVHGFTYDPSVGEFILTHENMQYPAKAKCYSVNGTVADLFSALTRSDVVLYRGLLLQVGEGCSGLRSVSQDT